MDMAIPEARTEGSSGAARLSRREMLGQTLLVAGATAIWPRMAIAEQPLTALGDEPRRLTHLGMELTEGQREAGIDFLAHHPSVDVHCHPGRFFLARLPYETPTSRAFGPPFERE